MSSRLVGLYESFFGINRTERLKLLLTMGVFFFVIGGYTVMKELGNSIFMTVVGKAYLPWAKNIAVVVLFPAILLYAYMVDRLRRYQLLMVCSLFFGIAGLIFAYFLGDAQIGIHNTDASPYRLFGWLFYFFVEGYSPFLVSVAWAFANSINTPEEAKRSYSLLVSGSKVGGMLMSATAWYILQSSLENGLDRFAVLNHQKLILLSSCSVLCVPLALYFLVRYVPGMNLHGYEAVYQLEKEREKVKKEEVPSLFGGLLQLIKQPYLLGIFGVIFFYETINVVLGYLRLLVVQGAVKDISGLSAALYVQIFWIHAATFIVSLIGTSALLRVLGERRCLLLVPIAVGILLFLFAINGTVSIVTLVYACVRILNYAIAYPIRETLYIPTVKEIKFKSKSWIDAFGSKIAKAFGAGFSLTYLAVIERFGAAAAFATQTGFFSVVVMLWIIVAYLLGKKFDDAVKNNKVIGFDD
jgi:ATP:ADP antiporter, AAA family